MKERDGYLVDVEYTGEFFPNLAPAWLGYIAAINGFVAPSLKRDLRWCELGCGKGVTALLLAATHPGGEFHACDFNAAHIDSAEKLRAAAGVGNVHFHCASFAQMLQADLPPFDFIVMHGVYSWVPEPVRAEIREFIRRRLAPNGLVMLSFNAMPGWSHLQPIRRMLHDYAESIEGDVFERARAAFAYVRFLADNGAAYFRAVPAAAKHLDEIARHDIRYVAHEYLTPHGDPFYFADVERAMSQAGLRFAGNMSARDNYVELMVPQPFVELLASAPTRTAIEMRRDVVLDTTFRQDLYTAQPTATRAGDPPLEALQAFHFCLVQPAERLPLRRTEGPLQFDLTGAADAVRAVHALLDGGPAGVWDLHRAAGCSTPDDTASLIQQLVVAQHLAPCPPERKQAGWSAVHAAMLDSALRERQRQVPLPCAHTASASSCEPIHAAAIEAACRFADADTAARQVLARVRACGHPVVREEPDGARRPASDGEVLAYVAATWRRLQDPSNTDRRQLQLLGIV